METPKMISQGIRRLFECADDEDGVPDSDRIIHDCDKAWDTMWTVYEEKGAVVEDLCNRNGNRYLTAGRGKKGGKREKGEYNADEGWTEPRLRQAIVEVQNGIVVKDCSLSRHTADICISAPRGRSRNNTTVDIPKAYTIHLAMYRQGA